MLGVNKSLAWCVLFSGVVVGSTVGVVCGGGVVVGVSGCGVVVGTTGWVCGDVGCVLCALVGCAVGIVGVVAWCCAGKTEFQSEHGGGSMDLLPLLSRAA